jgi:hypothetical protein
MTLTAFLQALAAALLTKLSSVGAALAAGFTAVVIGFTEDERAVLVEVKQTFLDEYNKRKAAGTSEIDAIEGAGTAAWNKFCADESAEMAKEADAIITLLVSSAKSAAGIVKQAVSG